MTRTFFIPAALALAITLPAVPAQAAGAPRTFLSAAGSDANSCTNVATPCRHMAAAFAATAPDGEIYVLDPANYGSLLITHAVSIEGHGWASIAPPANLPAIVINANPGDKINIIGVVLDGTAVSLATGILVESSGTLTVRDSVIRNFNGTGINFGTVGSSTLSHLFVSNTLISDNGGDGIFIATAITGNVTGSLDHVAMQNNGANGLNIQSNTNLNLNITVSDSVISDNGSNGINLSATGGANAFVRNSTITNNAVNGLLVGGSGCPGLGVPNAIIRVSRSTITGNTTGWLNTSCGAVETYADNNIDGNGSANTEPSLLTYK